jgi:hypothetical protein
MLTRVTHSVDLTTGPKPKHSAHSAHAKHVAHKAK